MYSYNFLLDAYEFLNEIFKLHNEYRKKHRVPELIRTPGVSKNTSYLLFVKITNIVRRQVIILNKYLSRLFTPIGLFCFANRTKSER